MHQVARKGIDCKIYATQLLAKCQKITHIEAKSVIAPTLAIVVETMLGTNAAEQVKKVPLSNDTIARRIEDISSDFKSHLVNTSKSLAMNCLCCGLFKLMNLRTLVAKLNCWLSFDS